MNLVLAAAIVIGAIAIGSTGMLLVRRRAPEGGHFTNGDRAAGVFGVLATGFSVLLGFIVFLVAGAAETNRPPFDLPEADAELVQGYMIEYGGTKMVAFLFAEYLNMLTVSLLAVTLFLGGWQLPFGIDPPTWVDPIVVLGKMFLFIFFLMWIRATLPRLRYDQLMTLGWKILLPVATLNALVSAILVVTLD